MSYFSKRMRSNLFGANGNGSRNNSKNRVNDEETEEQLERENEDELEILREKVAAIKSVALDIQDEVKAHNKILEGMGDQFTSARGLLKNTMGKSSLDKFIRGVLRWKHRQH